MYFNNKNLIHLILLDTAKSNFKTAIKKKFKFKNDLINAPPNLQKVIKVNSL